MLSTCTIPSDPGYDSNRSVISGRISSLEVAPRPRVKPEAVRNAMKNQGCIAQLFNPYAKAMGIGRQGISPGPQQKDFAKENYLKIRQIQRANKQKQSEPSREPLKAVHKPGKFEHVDSKVAEIIKEPPPAPRPGSATFLRAHSRSGPVVRDRPSSVEPVVPREFKLTVPKASIVKEHHPVRSNENIISRNIKRSVTPTHKRSPSAMAAEELTKKKEEEINSYKKGKVPSYLRKRQEQWRQEEEERIRNLPDPSIPPGHKLMPADERLRTLDVLQTSQKELTLQLNSLPVGQDTLRVQRRRSELEKKLAEIEAAIKIFSRPKVFVKIDS